ncbi:MAG: hypothetical protein HY717_14175 [Planctomycetes bacterium]|nr:hypothetical protein [Planctomycetota bacterium]
MDRSNRFLARHLILILALFSVWGLSACDSGKEEGRKETAASAEKVRDEVNELFEKLKQEGADKAFQQDFESARTKLEAAEKLFIEGKEPESAPKFRDAKRAFARLEKQLEEFKKRAEGALVAQKEVEKTKAELLSKKVDANAPRQFKEAQKTYEQGVALVRSGDPRKIPQAEQLFKQALNQFNDAGQVAKENLSYKNKADGEKKEMLEMKAKAVEAEAEKLAAQAMLDAKQQERAAEADYKEGSFQRAYEGYKQAVQSYAFAVEQANSIKAISGANQPAEGEKKEVAESGKTVPEKSAVPQPEKLEKPEAAEADSDDLFLADNIKKLAAGITGYDAVSGELTLTYHIGDILKKDIVILNLPKPEYLRFRELMGPDKKTLQGQEEDLGMSFEVNTLGFFLIPIPFLNEFTVEYKMELMMMKNEGSFSVVFFSDDKGKNQWQGDWVTFRQFTATGVPKSFYTSDKSKAISPNKWFIKTEKVGMLVHSEPSPKSPDKKLLFSVYYRVEDPAELPAPSNQIEVPLPKGGYSGYVGFYWKDVKARIRNLIIKGIIDKPATVKKLQEKLGIKPEAGGDTAKDGDKKEGEKGDKKTSSAIPGAQDRERQRRGAI